MSTEPYTPAELDGTWGGVDFNAVKVLIAHGRTRIEGCDCGWGMGGSKLGQSHALHVWRELQRAVLPDHDARTAEQIARAIEAVDTSHDWGRGDGLSDAAAIARAHATTEGDHHAAD